MNVLEDLFDLVSHEKTPQNVGFAFAAAAGSSSSSSSSSDGTAGTSVQSLE